MPESFSDQKTKQAYQLPLHAESSEATQDQGFAAIPSQQEEATATA